VVKVCFPSRRVLTVAVSFDTRPIKHGP
jgi:hypothetical protein